MPNYVFFLGLFLQSKRVSLLSNKFEPSTISQPQGQLTHVAALLWETKDMPIYVG